jgi:GTP-binding protein
VEAEFVISAHAPDQFPAAPLPEIAFLGRSNVGKSSLINCLVDQPGLARTSSRPGCTQAVHFYRVRKQFHFVDLPGYGYAQVSQEQTQRWGRLIEQYLKRREPLALSVLLLDARRGWMEMDLELRRWLEFHGRKYIVVATKIDKLKTQKERARSMATLREPYPEGEPVLFSAVTGQGVREIWQAIQTTRIQ